MIQRQNAPQKHSENQIQTKPLSSTVDVSGIRSTMFKEDLHVASENEENDYGLSIEERLEIRELAQE